MAGRLLLLTTPILALFVVGCDDDGGGSCTTASDCGEGEICLDGQCRPESGTDADADVDADGDGDGDADVDGDGDSDADEDHESATGQRCGPSLPCPAGWVCEGGLCEVDCGDRARCAGEVCCAEGDLCYLGECTTPGESCDGDTACGASSRCPRGEQCDPSLGRCMPLPSASDCEYRPDSSFEPEVLWSWEGSTEHPAYRHAITTPAVADLDGDGASDVVLPVVDSIPGSPTVGGILCALSGPGDCEGGPRELWCTSPEDGLVNWVAQVAVADLDHSGELTIIAGDGRPNAAGRLVNGIAGFDAAGARLPLFGTDAAGDPVDVEVFVGAPAVADLDGDGLAEVIVGFTVFNSEGRLVWQQPGGSGNGGFGPMTIALDLDGAPGLEVVGGNMAYHADGSEAWAADAPARALEDGWPAAADFDGDGTPELVVVSAGTVRLLGADGTILSVTPGSVEGHGGPPTVADVDGDDQPEVAVAGSNSLTVFDVGPAPDFAFSVLWTAESRDFSSNFTGSSVFDFDGDGRTEVIYGDECFARVYDGPGDGDGGTTVRFEVPNTSCTGTEYPVVADITGDGKAEFIVVANDASGMGTACTPYAEQCAALFHEYTTTHGVRAYRDRNDNWVATRPIWNQHSYHVTNICDGRGGVCSEAEDTHGAVPTTEPSSWLFPADEPLNRYRVNAQLEGLFNAPNLVARDLRPDLSRCPTALSLVVTVTNVGSLGVPAGVPVAFYRIGGDGRELLDVVHTERTLLPGGSERIELAWDPLPVDAADVDLAFEVVVDDDGTGGSTRNECVEDDNAAELQTRCSGLT